MKNRNTEPVKGYKVVSATVNGTNPPQIPDHWKPYVYRGDQPYKGNSQHCGTLHGVLLHRIAKEKCCDSCAEAKRRDAQEKREERNAERKSRLFEASGSGASSSGNAGRRTRPEKVDERKAGRD